MILSFLFHGVMREATMMVLHCVLVPCCDSWRFIVCFKQMCGCCHSGPTFTTLMQVCSDFIDLQVQKMVVMREDLVREQNTCSCGFRCARNPNLHLDGCYGVLVWRGWRMKVDHGAACAWWCNDSKPSLICKDAGSTPTSWVATSFFGRLLVGGVVWT